MKITHAEFITGAVRPRQYPKLDFPEVAFAGRSNVGKSSLINSLLNRKKLVKTSSTPGKTQMVNFFNINERFMFADLPGYGFAKVPLQVKRKWKNLLEQYLTQRDVLRTVVLLVDIRRNPTDLDLQMRDWLVAEDIDFILVATKADKLTQSERKKQLKKIREAFYEGEEGEVLPYSSIKNTGRKELWSILLERME